MPKGDFGGRRNTNGFDKNPENINKKGRPPSIRKEIVKLLDGDGGLYVPAGSVESINEDGSVIVRIPNPSQFAMKLFQLAMKGNLKALQMVLEQVDGKPTQQTNLDVTSNGRVFEGFNFLPGGGEDEEEKEE
jgi:hypothetical protein